MNLTDPNSNASLVSDLADRWLKARKLKSDLGQNQ